MEPLISVIIPVYNNETYLRRCIESVLHQTLRDIEVLCVNDGSTDGSKDILYEYASKDSRVIVFDRPNSGYGASINVGLERAQGEFIAILESDDFIDPSMYEALYDRACHYELDAIRANFNLFWSKPTEHDLLLEVFPRSICDQIIDPLDARYRAGFLAQPAIWSALYRKAMIDQNSLRLQETPGAAYQDTSFNFKTWVCARKAMLVHEPYVHYRQDNEASSINNPGKIYSICGEYEEIDRWLHEERPGNEAVLTPLVNVMRFEAYRWNCGRIAPAYRVEFAKMVSDVFVALQKRGRLDPSEFEPRRWLDCKLAMKDPQAFAYICERQDESISPLRKIARKVAVVWKYLRNLGVGDTVALFRGKLTDVQ